MTRNVRHQLDERRHRVNISSHLLRRPRPPRHRHRRRRRRRRHRHRRCRCLVVIVVFVVVLVVFFVSLATWIHKRRFWSRREQEEGREARR